MSDQEQARPPEGVEETPKAPLVSIDHFSQVELRVGRVLTAEAHPNAEKLMVLQVELGEETPRQIVAGIRAWWTPEELQGRQIVVVANLKPARLRGLESQGMLLAVKGEDRVIPLGVEGTVVPGTRVT